jgi:uncharacterized protein with HEPN domain
LTREFRDFLDDMLEAAERARTFTDGMSWEQFAADIKTQFAAARALEIIGEAARNIPKDFRDTSPEIPWIRVIGMRNILVHNYDGADPRIIYDTIKIAVPNLVDQLLRAIAKAGDGKPSR